MYVTFHATHDDLQCSLTEEKSVQIGEQPSSYRVLLLNSKDQHISIILTTQQVFKLIAALAEGLQKESEETNNECSGQ